MTTTPAATEAENVADVVELGDDLIRALSAVHGEPAAVRALMRSWLSVYGPQVIGPICAAALARTFGECLTTVRAADVKPGATSFTNQHERTSS